MVDSLSPCHKRRGSVATISLPLIGVGIQDGETKKLSDVIGKGKPVVLDLVSTLNCLRNRSYQSSVAMWMRDNARIVADCCNVNMRLQYESW